MKAISDRKNAQAAQVWIDFIQAIHTAKKQLGFQKWEECFFRGHRNESWKLLPTLQRHCQAENIVQLKDVQDLESALFFEFQSRSAQLQKNHVEDWEILFLMRHHGVATRLLDWTSVLGVALYFALRSAEAGDKPHIWVLNPYKLNKQNWGVRDLISPKYLGYDPASEEFWDYSEMLVSYAPPGMEWERPVAIYPVAQGNARLHAQRGYFTIHGDQNELLDVLNPDCAIRVDIPPEAIDAGKEFLDLAGINDYLMFPDLDGLTRDIHRNYGIGVRDSHVRPGKSKRS